MPFIQIYRAAGLDDDLNDILETLQLLTALAEAPSSANEPSTNEDDLMRGIYIVEHNLLNVLTEDAGGSGLIYHVRAAAVLAFGLYMYMGLREMPRTAMILGKLVKRLRGNMEAAQMANKLDVLDPRLLLWMGSLGVIAAKGRKDGVFFVMEVESASAELGLQSMEERSKVLKSIVWMEKVGGLRE